MTDIKKTVLKEVSTKNDTGDLDAPVSIGADFEHIIDVRSKHKKHYTLDQFFDHYINFMLKGDFVYRGDEEPKNKHTRIWIDTNEPIQEYHDPQPVYYAINQIANKAEVILSSNPLTGDIKQGVLPTAISSVNSLPWGIGAENIVRFTIKDPIYPSNMKCWLCNQSSKDLVITGLEKINVSAVTDMSYCFCRVKNLTNSNSFRQWNTSNVTDLQECFALCEQLTEVSGLKNWDTSKVTNLYACFYQCASIKSFVPIEKWNVSKVSNFSSAFAGTTCPIPSWGV